MGEYQSKGPRPTASAGVSSKAPGPKQDRVEKYLQIAARLWHTIGLQRSTEASKKEAQ